MTQSLNFKADLHKCPNLSNETYWVYTGLDILKVVHPIIDVNYI